jgi:phosphinothricin acetyltransferase
MATDPSGPAADLVLRPAEPHDAARISGIHRPYVLDTVITFDTEPLPAEGWRDKLAAIRADGWPFLVAELAGRVVGFAYVSAYRPKAAYRHTVEDTIYLDGTVTGRGLGGRLLTALLDAAAAAGARQVIAVVADPGAEPSIRLHTRLGFVDAGRLRAVGWKFGRPVDTVQLQLDLSARS